MKFSKLLHTLSSIVMFIFISYTHAQDPGLSGNMGFEKLEYNLGDTFRPTDYQNSDVEVRASVHRPTAASSQPFPLVIILHGRHNTCYKLNNINNGANKYPCDNDEREIPNYAGYDYVAELLASQGNIVVSISSNGIIGTAGSNDYPDDDNMLARAELIQHHLELWKDYNSNSSGPFGSDFIGKIDLNNVITIGHSRGGEGVVRHFIYNKKKGSPFKIKGVFAIAPTSFHKYTAEKMNLAVLLPYCDGDLFDLQGLFYYDAQRYSFTNNTSAYHNFLFMGANHNYFNTIWTPGGFVARTGDDWQNQDSNLDNPFCGSNSPSRFSPEKQRKALLPYISAFVQKYTKNTNQYNDILRGVNPQPPASSTLDPEDIHISYHAPDEERSDINRMTKNNNTTNNTLGGQVTTFGLSRFEICGLNNESCGNNPRLDNHFRGSSFSLSRIRIEWNLANGWYQNTLPESAQDLSNFTHLTFRSSVNMNTGNTALNTATQNFTIEITDTNGKTASTEVGNYSKALFVPKGKSSNSTENNVLPHTVSNTVAIPLSAFTGLDTTKIQAFRFIFNKTDSGSILLSDISFTSFICIEGLSCSDGDPCTSGETYDADCNCTGGIPSPNDSDNDGVCDEFDICDGGDDTVDTDFDEIPDFCDPCPLFPDSDGDGVCDDTDACPGEDDTIDADQDNFPDKCDICPTDSTNLCVPENYCTSEGFSNSFSWVEAVKFDTVENRSGPDNDSYGNYTQQPITVNAGSSYPLTLTPGLRFASGISWKVWIDFNRDAIFDNNTEVIYQSNNNDNIRTATIDIPANSINGGARMRISCTTSDSELTPCGSIFAFGETEDYALLIENGQTLNVTDPEEGTEFSITPNPSNDHITISHPNQLILGKLVIYDLTGKEVLSRNMSKNKSQQIITHQLPNGIYVVRLSMFNGNALYQKLVVNKFSGK